MATPLAAVVLCAGKGTRMKSDRAKVLHPVLGRPLCSYSLSRALQLGASPVVAVVGHQAEQVQRTVEGLFPNKPLKFAVQAQQLGTGHAVRSAQAALHGYDGPVLILYGDTPLLRLSTLQALKEAYEKAKAPLALVSATPADPTGYGRVLREGGKVLKVVEHKDCTETQRKISEVNAGIYLADAAFLWRSLATLKPANAQGEYYLTDLVELAAREGGVAAVQVDFEDTAGANDRAELAALSKVLRERINTAWMKAGVSFVDPSNTYVEEGVELGADCELGPLVSLQGATKLGKNVRVGQGSILTNVTVADGTTIKPYSVLDDSTVGPNCEIGPFARVRPGSELAEGVHLGNFVETKKARIGKKSKANHLSYLGDAVIGAGVNVGAGTITCNYDGVNKFVTELGDNVFIGSDTQLVAPVKVGAGAYVAAGTTVTQDVPPMSLGISRVPQVNKEGWVEKKKKAKPAK